MTPGPTIPEREPLRARAPAEIISDLSAEAEDFNQAIGNDYEAAVQTECVDG